MWDTIQKQAAAAARELCEVAALQPGDLLVVGCSSSEIVGKTIGHGSSEEAARAVLDGLFPVLCERGIFLAAQCCEHLNRALILEEEVARRRGYEPVCVVPKPKAGGSFATALYTRLSRPVAVEFIRAEAGMDIGNTLIGMHLKAVAVPVRLSIAQIGQAPVVCARTRPKFIGGARAQYE